MDVPDSDPPDAAVVMLRTRLLNDWAGTAYTFEEVAGMDPLVFDMLGALKQGLAPKARE